VYIVVALGVVVIWLYSFLGLFAKLRDTTISFVMFASPYVTTRP
jgi:hypothetical protein